MRSRQLLERCMAYLPLCGMALLALGTYWLVQTTPAITPSHTPQAPTHEPDYFLHQFSVRSFHTNGQLRTEVTGTQARHYPDKQQLDVDSIRIRSFDQQQRLTTASAHRGLATDDGSEVQLLGQAVVVRDAYPEPNGTIAPRMEYRGEFLHAFLKSERVISHLPVEISRGNNRFTADSLAFDNPQQSLQLRGRVRGILVPDRPPEP